MKTILLGQLTNEDHLAHSILEIQNSFELEKDEIFILKDRNSDQLLLNFKIKESRQIKSNFFRMTYLESSNTLIAENALSLIQNAQLNQMSSERSISWNSFKDSLLLAYKGNVEAIKLEFYDMISFGTSNRPQKNLAA